MTWGALIPPRSLMEEAVRWYLVVVVAHLPPDLESLGLVAG